MRRARQSATLVALLPGRLRRGARPERLRGITGPFRPARGSACEPPWPKAQAEVELERAALGMERRRDAATKPEALFPTGSLLPPAPPLQDLA